MKIIFKSCIIISLIVFNGCGGIDPTLNNSFIEQVEKGNLDSAKALLPSLFSKGADINAIISGESVTALMMASIEGNIEMVKLLLSKGANVNAVSSDGHNFSALGFAIVEEHNEIVKILIENKANINIKLNFGAGKGSGSPLMLVAGSGNLELVELLISKGADVNVKYGNRTALKAAANNDKTEVVQVLEKAGATE